jgi:hypothetical protein
MRRRAALVLLPCGVAAALTLPAACRPAEQGSAREGRPARGYTVSWIGELRAVHLDGDARPRASLRQIEPRRGAFAIGPLAGLRGEITVIDGAASIARAGEDGERVDRGFDHEAAFLVFGRVGAWRALPLPEEVRDGAALERWLPGAAAVAGLRAGEPFPFKIETGSSTVAYHVIANREPGYHVSRPHRELMRFFTIDAEPVILIGVHSTAHAGVFTHHGQATHTHVVSGDGRRSGHVDELRLGPGSVAYLPVP